MSGVWPRTSFSFTVCYTRGCVLLHTVLAQYFAFAHHRQEHEQLYDSAYVSVIARSLGHFSEDDPHLLLAIEPASLGIQRMWGMKLLKKFPLHGERFKICGGERLQPVDFTEHFDLVYLLDHPEGMQDHPGDIDGATLPQRSPPPPQGTSGSTTLCSRSCLRSGVVSAYASQS
ncbi:hypothetical protein Hanom_Chr01g00079411 [Helianthus anomalus]